MAKTDIQTTTVYSLDTYSEKEGFASVSDVDPSLGIEDLRDRIICVWRLGNVSKKYSEQYGYEASYADCYVATSDTHSAIRFYGEALVRVLAKLEVGQRMIARIKAVPSKVGTANVFDRVNPSDAPGSLLEQVKDAYESGALNAARADLVEREIANIPDGTDEPF
jgi:hypothetical protein